MGFAGCAGHQLNTGQGSASGSETSTHQGGETGERSILNYPFKHLVLTIRPCILPCAEWTLESESVCGDHMVSDYSEGRRVGTIIFCMVLTLVHGTANADTKERCGAALPRREIAQHPWLDSGMCMR